MVTAYGVAALGFMMAMYVLERRGRFRPGVRARVRPLGFIRFLSGAWPFGIIEAAWAFIALRRFLQTDG